MKRGVTDLDNEGGRIAHDVLERPLRHVPQLECCDGM